MNSRLIVLVFLLVIFVGGCAIFPRPYQEPPPGNTALLIFRNTTSGMSEGALYEDAAACSRRYVTGPIKPREQRSFRVKAGNELAFAYGHDTGVRMYCIVVVSFYPIPGEIYEATLSEAGGKCYLGVVRLGFSPDTPSRGVDVRQRQHKEIFGDQNSDFCEPYTVIASGK